MSACRALDGDGDGKASVNELVRAVSNSLKSWSLSERGPSTRRRRPAAAAGPRVVSSDIGAASPRW